MVYVHGICTKSNDKINRKQHPQISKEKDDWDDCKSTSTANKISEWNYGYLKAWDEKYEIAIYISKTMQNR